MISSQELIRILSGAPGDGPALASALVLLRALPRDSGIPDSPIPTAELLHTQRRRARRRPADVQGLEQLVSSLEALEEPEVRLAVTTNAGWVATVVLTVNYDLVGCVVGPDRRGSAEWQRRQE